MTWVLGGAATKLTLSNLFNGKGCNIRFAPAQNHQAPFVFKFKPDNKYPHFQLGATAPDEYPAGP
jgi:hypothetical protein